MIFEIKVHILKVSYEMDKTFVDFIIHFQFIFLLKIRATFLYKQIILMYKWGRECDSLVKRALD